MPTADHMSSRSGGRTRWAQPLHVALLLVSALAVTDAVTVVVVVPRPPQVPHLTLAVALFAALGVVNVLLGVLAWWRRPHNRTGVLLCVCGFLFILAMAANSELPVLYPVGFVAGQATVAAVLHVLLAFPSGRLSGPADRVLVMAAYGVTAGFDTVRIARILTGDLLPGQESGFDRWFLIGQRTLGALVLLAAGAHLVTRVRGSRMRRPVAERRALAAVYGWGVVVLWFIPLSANVIAPALRWQPLPLFVAQTLALLTMPIAFSAGLLRGGFAHIGRIEELGATLASGAGGYPDLRSAVAGALGDPSADLVIPAPSGAPAPGRGRVLCRGSSGTFGAIEYDLEFIADPRPVIQVADVVSLALERDHLLAELVAGREQVVASRARLVEVADAERRRVVTQLHDVVQSRLVLAAAQLGAAVARPGVPADDGPAQGLVLQVRDRLDETLDEIRRLIQGLLPATLTDLGLVAAVEELLERTPLRSRLTLDDAGRGADVPDTVAFGAYAIVAEAVANAVKHSRATELVVDLARQPGRLVITVADDGRGGVRPGGVRPDGTGLGLQSMADRAEAMGGRLTIESPPGEGTLVRAELPCGS
ncbi:sensor histidine kinase [Spongisporangium articulatum]|uniref:Oxygen sensor histidine kinase NreB n=1 Tax=Spongisporangium articulatum TaxID=3362603 RepID=A0ABW8AP32_9ACTN